MSDYYYFAADGNYGEARLEVLDTSQWTEFDWKSVEECSNELRMIIARGIADRYKFNEDREDF